MAWADDGSIVLDFVRHGESGDNDRGIIDTLVARSRRSPDTGEPGRPTEPCSRRMSGNGIAGIYRVGR